MYVGYQFGSSIRMLMKTPSGRYGFVNIDSYLERSLESGFTYIFASKANSIARAKKAGHKLIEFDSNFTFTKYFFPNAEVSSKPIQETTMSSNTFDTPVFETITTHYFNGNDLARMLLSDFTKHVASVEAQLDTLSDLSSPSKKVNKHIKQLRKSLAKAIEVYDTL